MTLEIRKATSDEAEALTTLAHQAKRYWNYPAEWIDYWKAELTITPEFIRDHEVFVAVFDQAIAGCCALVISEALAEIEHMWIDPKQMGNGIGRALFEHAQQRALDLGFNVLELSADPNAEGFYKRMGAERIGEIPADLFGNARVLPRMRIEFGVPPLGGSPKIAA